MIGLKNVHQNCFLRAAVVTRVSPSTSTAMSHKEEETQYSPRPTNTAVNKSQRPASPPTGDVVVETRIRERTQSISWRDSEWWHRFIWAAIFVSFFMGILAIIWLGAVTFILENSVSHVERYYKSKLDGGVENYVRTRLEHLYDEHYSPTKFPVVHKFRLNLTPGEHVQVFGGLPGPANRFATLCSIPILGVYANMKDHYEKMEKAEADRKAAEPAAVAAGAGAAPRAKAGSVAPKPDPLTQPTQADKIFAIHLERAMVEAYRTFIPMLRYQCRINQPIVWYFDFKKKQLSNVDDKNADFILTWSCSFLHDELHFQWFPPGEGKKPVIVIFSMAQVM